MTVAGFWEAHLSRVTRVARLGCVPLALLAVVLGGGCSHPEGDELVTEPEGENGGGHDGGVPKPATAAASPTPDGSTLDGATAAADRDKRAIVALAVLADAGRFCGEKDLPDCPLQQWMKRNATPPIRSGETIALAEAFDEIEGLAPAARDAYPNWGSIARDGALASRVGDVTAAKAACRGCHTQYRARYHAELRALPLPNLPPRR
jgi:hypothetical protein